VKSAVAVLQMIATGNVSSLSAVATDEMSTEMSRGHEAMKSPSTIADSAEATGLSVCWRM
jgi:hypothetical protein